MLINAIAEILLLEDSFEVKLVDNLQEKLSQTRYDNGS